MTRFCFHSTFFLLVTLVTVTLQGSLVLGIGNGVYKISRSRSMYLTPSADADGAVVDASALNNIQDEQEWTVMVVTPGSGDAGDLVTIRNRRWNKFLSFDTNYAQNGQRVVVEGKSRHSWELHASTPAGSYFVLVPAGLVKGGERLAVDISALTIYPPITDLSPWTETERGQAWVFDKTSQL
ncbi:hypothetical protein CPC16_005597 [Podila verticillata]|nr:hypothetical protein BGZ52_001359 [Haplosporangium bisporale]KAF9389729.1 hypothetical protein CPC16_005597 [Podila verticillata]KAI9242467.1 MAG: hypothetical protein BYD32DRAFT_403108 [Podila humilis]